jgi:hypothetical protein
MKTIDVEKDYFAVIRDGKGRFHRFYWFSADEFTVTEISAKIADFNEKHKDADDVFIAELVADKLVKEICAYRQQSMHLEDIIESAGEIQKGIDEVIDSLKDALSDLNRIKVLW